MTRPQLSALPPDFDALLGNGQPRRYVDFAWAAARFAAEVGPSPSVLDGVRGIAAQAGVALRQPADRSRPNLTAVRSPRTGSC